MVVFFWIIFVITPPSVSIPSESGVTSSSTSFLSPASTEFDRRAVDGFRVDVLARLLPNRSLTTSTFGMRVWPPTGFVLDVGHLHPGVLQRGLHGPTVRWISSRPGFELGARQLDVQVLRPDASAVMYGRLISVDDDSSIFAFSAASFRRCSAARPSTGPLLLLLARATSMMRWWSRRRGTCRCWSTAPQLLRLRRLHLMIDVEQPLPRS